MRISRIDAPTCEAGESPMWDARTQVLHYVDNRAQKIHSFNSVTGASRTFDMPGVATTLVLREGGGAVVTLRTGIHFLDLETGELELVHPLPDPPPYVYNDGKVDSRGRFVIGACSKQSVPQPDGGLFRLDPDRSLRRIDSDIHLSNGPCWSPDEKTFYFADSWLKTVYAYDYDIETGDVANRRVFAKTDELGGVPDGATVDEDGLVWVAIFRGGKIAAFRPDGKLERVVEVPINLVSSLSFGGPELDRIYATTISRDFTAEARGLPATPAGDHAGSVLVIEGLGMRGKAEHRFAA